MKKFVPTMIAATVAMAMAAPAAHAAATQTGPYTIECDGKGTSCASLKTACEDGGANYTPLKGGGGKCTVGSAAGPSYAAKKQSVAKIKNIMGLRKKVNR